MKAAAFNFLIGRPEGVDSTELARALFKSDLMGDKLSKKLINSWLGDDSRFRRDERGLWHIKGECPAPDRPSKSLLQTTFCVVDVETTGGAPPDHKMTELAAVKVKGYKISGQFCTLLNPKRDIPYFITRLTGISEKMVSKSPIFEQILPAFLGFIGSSVIVAHYSSFDLKFINSALVESGYEPLKNEVLCTCKLARRLLPEVNSRSLDSLAARFAIGIPHRHRALGDASATAEILVRFLTMLDDKGIRNLGELLRFQRSRAFTKD